MAKYPASVAAYGKPGGGQWQAGDTIVLPDLGRTLRAIATKGPDAFYTGWIADSIAAAMARERRADHQDAISRAYQAKVRAPVRGKYHGYEIISMPPPSSGGVTMIEMLNILENFDLPKLGAMSPQALHYEIEAMRRGYLDRARFLGDPDFVKMPLERLMSKSYAKTLAASIDPTHASKSAELGQGHRDADRVDRARRDDALLDRRQERQRRVEHLHARGWVRLARRGRAAPGFILNNEMGDFNKKPGETNARGDIGTPANLIAPGKRMLSSMSPTIVTKNGKLFMVVGSPGGRTIINTVMEIVLNGDRLRDGRAPGRRRAALPSSVAAGRGRRSSETRSPTRPMQRCRRWVTPSSFGGTQGDGHTIIVKNGVAYGANDRRSSDSKASVP